MEEYIKHEQKDLYQLHLPLLDSKNMEVTIYNSHTVMFAQALARSVLMGSFSMTEGSELLYFALLITMWVIFAVQVCVNGSDKGQYQKDIKFRARKLRRFIL